MALNPPFGDLERDSDRYFVILFTVETCLKILAFGFIGHSNAYLRTGWNVLDFIVVITGLISLILRGVLPPDDVEQLAVFQALRAVRVLRPLRTISRVPGMRVIVLSLLNAAPQLVGVSVLFLFVLLIFGVLGIQLFSGFMHSRCYGQQSTTRAISEVLCYAGAAAVAGGGGNLPALCVAEAVLPVFDPPPVQLLPVYQSSVPISALRVHELHVAWDAPASSTTPPVSLTVGLSLDNVSWTYYDLWPTAINPPLAPPLPSNAAPVAPPPPLLPPPTSPRPSTSCVEAAMQPGERYSVALPEGGVITRWVRLALNAECAPTNVSLGNVSSVALSSLELRSSEHSPVSDMGMCCNPSVTGIDCGLATTCPDDQLCLWDARHPNGVNSFDNIIYALLTIFQVITREGWSDIMYMLQDSFAYVVFIYFWVLIFIGSFVLLNLVLAVIFESFSSATITQHSDTAHPTRARRGRCSMQSLKAALFGRGILAKVRKSKRLSWLMTVQSQKMASVTHNRWFERLSLLLIVTNTLILCTYYHDMDYELEQALEYSNLVLTELFTIELICNVAGQGIASFFTTAFNIFDAIIVLTSQVESVLFLQRATACSGAVDLAACLAGGGIASFSVLRLFRLLRFLKLAHALPGLRQIILTLAKSVYSMANLLCILVLLMFIFALLGMHVWRDAFTPENGFAEPHCVSSENGTCLLHVPSVRHHFDRFQHAFVTTFVVISGEEWNEVWFDCYQALGGTPTSGWFAHVYFLLLYSVGNTVVLSLFIAIMLQHHFIGSYEAKGQRRGLVRALVLRYRGKAPETLKQMLYHSPRRAESRSAKSSGGMERGAEFSTMLQQQSDASNASMQETLTEDSILTEDSVLCATGASTPSAPFFDMNKAVLEKAAVSAPMQSLARQGSSGKGNLVPDARRVPRAPQAPMAPRAPTTLHAPMAPRAPACGSSMGRRLSLASMPPISSGAAGPTLCPADCGEQQTALKAMCERKMRHINRGEGEGCGWGAVRQATKPHKDSIVQFKDSKSSKDRNVKNVLRAWGRLGNRTGSTTAKWDPMEDFHWAVTKGASLESRDSLQGSSTAIDSSLSRAPTRANSRHAKQLASLSTAHFEYVPVLDRDLALCYFRRDHPVRAAALRLIASRIFDNIILLLIIFSSLCLAVPHMVYPSLEDRCLSNPLDTAACSVTDTLSIVDIVFTALFTLEACAKVVGLGLCIPSPTAYLRDPWNVLDFLVVIVSLLELGSKYSSVPISGGGSVVPTSATVAEDGTGENPLATLKMLRAMRCLRPLRVISRNPGMKMVVNALLRALPGVANVSLVMMSLLLIFGILGVQLFMGKFSECAVPGIRTSLVCESDDAMLFGYEWRAPGYEWRAHCVVPWITTRVQCEATAGLVWEPPNFGHFDNVGHAILCLFEMSALERWPEVMYHGMDIVGTDVAPQRDSSFLASLFFISWIFVGAFCFNNLVVGVVVANFTQIKEQEGSFALMTEGQREWIDTMNRSTRLQPRKTYRPVHPKRRVLWELVNHTYFELVIQSLIVANVALMVTYFCVPTPPADGVGHGSCVTPDWNASLQRISNYAFAAAYLGEALLKISAYGSAYFYYPWNVFDFCLVCGSLLDVTVEVAFTLADINQEAFFNPAALRSLKIVRISRLLRLVRHAPRLRTLIVTFVSALPALINVGSLLFLLLFIFAVLGVSLFSHVPMGEFVDIHANFHTIGVALLTLFRAVTGETWNGIMHECFASDAAWAVLYFVPFNLIGSFVLLNLVVAVILENFGTAIDDATCEVPQAVMLQYREEWEKLDPDAVGNISSDKLMLLLRRVREPLGFKTASGVEISRTQQLQFMAEMGTHLRDHGGRVNFQILLQALTQYTHASGKYGEEAADDGSDMPPDYAQQLKVTRQLKAAMKATHAYDLPAPQGTQAELHAALTLQAAWRGHRSRPGGRRRGQAKRRRSSFWPANGVGGHGANRRFSMLPMRRQSRNSGTGRPARNLRRLAIFMPGKAARPAHQPGEPLVEALRDIVQQAVDNKRAGHGTPGATALEDGTERLSVASVPAPQCPAPSGVSSSAVAFAAADPPSSTTKAACESVAFASDGTEVPLEAFDESSLLRCKSLRVPADALHHVPGCSTIGLFVHAETSARSAASADSEKPSPIGCLSNLFRNMDASIHSDPGGTYAQPQASPAQESSRACTWSAESDGIAYQWVPVHHAPDEADVDPSSSSSCMICYDPFSKGVGQLDASRIVPDPQAALAHVRKHVLSPHANHESRTGLSQESTQPKMASPASCSASCSARPSASRSSRRSASRSASRSGNRTVTRGAVKLQQV